ncbi:16S rRNA-processing protein RimM [Moraxella macacae 0408225]|uniref:Ribosome maturation factor RimM n=1 Tax=Moraxella macacae 0408225 TaxID=1230338 RepID=L2F8R0_9GAMM|nr:ribosome maturation factor RimM [Moraxella macacae]ELA09131.1 16S rRNA-processing protein RimM [Moraxella macacae 0408225]
MDNLIKIGELKKPYGIQGWLWLFSYTEDREAIFAMQPWIIKTALGEKTLTVKNWRSQGKGYVVQLNEITCRNVAETMFGVTLWADRQHLSGLAEDEYYWADLVGLTVKSQTDNVVLGYVKELFETGAHAIMVVEPTDDSVDDEKRLIPWHKQTILAVNLAEQIITVDWGADY